MSIINETTNTELDNAAQEIQEVSRLYLENMRNKKDNNSKYIKLKQQIHDILFEEQKHIPEGVYIKLMNILKE